MSAVTARTAKGPSLKLGLLVQHGVRARDQLFHEVRYVRLALLGHAKRSSDGAAGSGGGGAAAFGAMAQQTEVLIADFKKSSNTYYPHRHLCITPLSVNTYYYTGSARGDEDVGATDGRVRDGRLVRDAEQPRAGGHAAWPRRAQRLAGLAARRPATPATRCVRAPGWVRDSVRIGVRIGG